MNILEQVKQNYNKVIEYHRLIQYDTKLGTIWTDNESDISIIVRESKSPEELIDRVDMCFLYSINFAPELGENTGIWRNPGDKPEIRNRQIDWLLQRLPEFPIIQESPYIHSRNKVIRKDKTFSGNFLRTYAIALKIEKYFNRTNTFLELGGGAGHQARTLSLLFPDSKYTIVDLPETLFFSFTHLSLCFPDKKILYVTCPEQIQELDNYDLCFVPAVFAPLMHGRKYDLFLNTASLGEMRNDVIHQWMDWVENKLEVKNLFTLNRFLNTVNEGQVGYRSQENECSVSYDKQWKMLHWELEPIYCRCPWIDTLHSRYLEIIASRPHSHPENRSDELTEDAMSEDWCRLDGYYGNGVMQARDNVLVNDMTMSGTLFKLWEAIRLKPTQRNVSAMLCYLDRITVNHPFEEVFYFQRLLASLQKMI